MASKQNQQPTLAQIGIIPEFNGETDDWTVYREIMEEFFKANGVLETNKVSVLISLIGIETYRILRDLCHPDAPNEKTYVQLCDILAKQFVPQIAIFRERTKFFQAEQRRREDVKSWYARLRKLSIDCSFGAYQESLLLDKFVTGLRPGPIKDRLCEENETLTLKDALDLATNKESAIQDDAMAGDLAGMNLYGRRRGHGRHGRHGHHGEHGPHGHPGEHGPYGPPHGRHFGGPPHFGPMMGHFGPHSWMDARRFGGPMMAARRGDPRMMTMSMEPHGCPFKHRGREMKRWAKKWRKHGRRSSSSSSSSTSSSSSSSDSDEDNENKKKRKCKRKEGHKGYWHGHGRRHGHGHGFAGPEGCRRGRGRKGEQTHAGDQTAPTETEPELIE